MYLTELELVEIRNEGNYTNMYPTIKGLDIALQNEKIKNDMKLKIATISFTAVFALTAVFTFLFVNLVIFNNLYANFDYIYPLIDKLLQGKEVLVQDSVYRMKRIKADTSLDYISVI